MATLYYRWKRYWCTRGGTVSLADMGYLYPPDSKWASVYNPQVIPFESFSSGRVLVLLGEPGIGKTQTMLAEHQQTDAVVTKTGGRTLLVPLGQYGSEDRLIRELLEHPIVADWKNGAYDLHIFLDSLDEALLRIDTISEILTTSLAKLPFQRLYLRIACRTADWPNDLEHGLQELFGKDSVSAYELVPLQKKDVAEAAIQNGLDAEAFLNEIAARGVVPFAIKPVTLDMLINIYRQHGKFPKSQAELYLQGCRLLCEVRPQPQLRGPHQIQKLTPDQRLAVGSRVAAVTVFSRRFAVWTDIEKGDVPEEDVTIRELAGGTEPVNGDSVNADERAIWEALETGLFTARGQNRLGWAHQTYAEFLAARYLVAHGLTLEQMLSLFVHPSDPGGRIVPQLNETAAWAASLFPRLFPEITERDPKVLLKSDVAGVDLADRVALVDALLNLFDQEQLVDSDWEIRKTYSKLKHPRLSDQLRPYILDNSKGVIARRVAIDIAEACELQSLQNELADVALDTANAEMIRVNAAYAVGRVADDTTKARLEPLAFGQAGDDPDDELKGVAPLALWPKLISAHQLFSILTPPKRTNLLGAYQGFIDQNLTGNLQSDDLPEALRWVETQIVPAPGYSLYSGLTDDIMIKAWENLDAPGVLQAFGRAALSRVDKLDGIVTERGIGNDANRGFIDDLSKQDEKRHRVLEVILPLVEEFDKNYVWLFFSHTPLVLEKDIRWLVDKAKATINEDEQHRWALLIERIASWYTPEQLQELTTISQGNTVLVTMVERLLASYPEREAERKKWQKPERKQAPITPSPEARIAEALDKSETKDSGAWWVLNLEMTLDPTRGYYGNEFESDLTLSPGWKAADDKTRERILAAAHRYLIEKDPETSKWKDGAYHRPALAGYRALELLQREAPGTLEALPSNVWKKWATVINLFPNKRSSNEEIHKRLLGLAYSHAPDEIIQSILQIVDEENRSPNTYISFELDACWDERLATTLKAKVADPQLKPESVGALLGLLLDHNVSAAKDFALSLIPLASSSLEEEKAKARIGLEVLIGHTCDASWSSTWPVIQSHPEIGKQVVLDLAQKHDRRTPAVASKLTESQLADLYIWVARQFPYSEKRFDEVAHVVGPGEMVFDWQNGLLQNLKTRGTFSAADAIQRIIQELPELRWLRWTLLESRDIARSSTWVAPRPADILKLATSKDHRLVHW
jgi:predicted NACHT family NTPase